MAFTQKQIQQAMKVAAMMLGNSPASVAGGAISGAGRALGEKRNVRMATSQNAPLKTRAERVGFNTVQNIKEKVRGAMPRSMQGIPPRPDVLIKRGMVEGAAKRKLTGY